MDASTLFLVRFFGPVFVVIGISIVLHQAKYLAIVSELKKFTVSYYFAALLALCTGMAIVLVHNRWETLPEILVSIIGWGGIIKGIVRLLLPDVANTAMTTFATRSLLPVWGIVVIVWGGYMAWMGFGG